MKKLLFLSLVFLFVGCSKEEAPLSNGGKGGPNCKCTHVECPCPHNCPECYCNQ